ncbi:hypothetical protein [Chromobacterium phragmitis]|uniref:Toxin HicA n=1 Tax=Chromobacterium phragmitis TaxID=2202141 RepID=A0ABV0IUG3_9NEIS|nr:hypothetical protein [Chromobacterium phragmitis]
MLDEYRENHRQDEALTEQHQLSWLETVCREKFGEPRQQGTSHQIYEIPGGGGRINIQNDHGKAKSYQVRQVLKALEQLEKPQNG